MKFLIALSFLFSGSAAFACHMEHGKDMPAMSKEDRAKMASAHEAMAACLKSERSDKECMDEMHKSHGEMHGPMHGDKDHGKKKGAAKP